MEGYNFSLEFSSSDNIKGEYKVICERSVDTKTLFINCEYDNTPMIDKCKKLLIESFLGENK